MSKRLRSSMRTRGRLLRPRAAQPRPAEADAPNDDALEEAEDEAEGSTAAVTTPEPVAATVTAPEPVAAAVTAPEPVAVTVTAPETAAATVTAPETVAATVTAPETAAAPEDESGEIQQDEQPKIQASDPGHDDADRLSMPSEFSRAEEDSVPPVSGVGEHEHEHDLEPAPEPLSPAALARRARLRRVVGAIVGFAGVLAVLGVSKSLLRPSSAPMTPPAPVAAAPAGEVKPAAKPEAPAAPPAQPAPAAPPPQESAPSQPAPASTEAAAPAPVEAKAADPAEGKKLQQEALGLLNRGKRTEAIEAARAAIAADPSDAMSYLYLGSALQDSGKWKEGIEAYSDCVRTATRGPVHECSAMGGRK